MLYAAYGMNTNLQQMAGRCPNAISLGRAELPDYELAFRGCADITPIPGSSMEVVLWDITEDCLDALDVLEGYPSFYDRYSVDVLHDGEWKSALIYKMNASDLFPPAAGYLRMLVEGYVDHGCDLHQLYNAVDDAEAADLLVQFRESEQYRIPRDEAWLVKE